MGTGHSWIDALDDGLAGQRRILRRLLEFCESHDEARWLAVSCSLARGAADRWSDVDAGLGVRAGTVAELAGELPDFLAQDAEITAVLRHVFGSAEKAVLRSFVQFADGTQLDLVLVDAASRPGRAPDEIVLADKDGRLAEPFVPSVDVVTPEQIHEWAFLGWTALADAAKADLRAVPATGRGDAGRGRTAVATVRGADRIRHGVRRGPGQRSGRPTVYSFYLFSSALSCRRP